MNIVRLNDVFINANTNLQTEFAPLLSQKISNDHYLHIDEEG